MRGARVYRLRNLLYIFNIHPLLLMVNIREKLIEYKRVLNVTRRPTKDEYTSSAKVTSIGIALIGLIGFSVFLAFILLGI